MTIKEIRQSLGLSQQAFGEEFGIPRRTIQNWEGGINECPSYTLAMIEKIINLESKLSQMEG